MTSPGILGVLANRFMPSASGSCSLLIKYLVPLVGMVFVLAAMLREFELPVEKAAVAKQRQDFERMGDNIFIDILDFTFLANGYTKHPAEYWPKSHCLWEYDAFGKPWDPSVFCHWYRDRFVPEPANMDAMTALLPIINCSGIFVNQTMPFDDVDLRHNKALYPLYKQLEEQFFREFGEHYATKNCLTDCFPNPRENEYFHPKMQNTTEKYSLFWPNEEAYFKMEWRYTRDCSKVDAYDDLCIPIVCPLVTPTVEQVEACRLVSKSGGAKFNHTCLKESDSNCPNCENFAWEVHEGLSPLNPDEKIAFSHPIPLAEIYMSFRKIYDDSTPPAYYNWDWGGSIFFSLTIVSTIGYGSFAPSTDESKIALMILSLPLIGLFGFALGEATNIMLGAIAGLGVFAHDVLRRLTGRGAKGSGSGSGSHTDPTKRRATMNQQAALSTEEGDEGERDGDFDQAPGSRADWEQIMNEEFLAALLRKHDVDKSGGISEDEMAPAVLEVEEHLATHYVWEVTGEVDQASIDDELGPMEERRKAVGRDLERRFAKAAANGLVDGEGEIDRFEALAMLSAEAHKRAKKFRQKQASGQLHTVGGLYLTFWVAGSVYFKYIGFESEASFCDAFYFTIITSSSIGLGDFAPDFMHTASLAVWVVYVLLTLSLAGALISRLTEMDLSKWRLDSLCFCSPSPSSATKGGATASAAAAAAAGTPLPAANASVVASAGAGASASTGGKDDKPLSTKQLFEALEADVLEGESRSIEASDL